MADTSTSSAETQQPFAGMFPSVTPAMTLNFLPDPIPLRFKQRREDEEFPIDALVDTLRWEVEAIQDKAQLPVEMAAMSVLAVASLAAQTHANVKNPRGHIRPLSLFMLSVGKSGERKSYADSIAMQPVKDYECRLEIDYASRMKHYKDAHATWSAAHKAITSNQRISMAEKMAEINNLGPEPVKPMLPQLTCSEPTIEGLLTLFQNGWPSLGIFSDEGSTFTGGYAMSDEARLRTGSALCKFWDGDTVDRTRKSTEESYRLKNRRLALHLMIQPDIADDFLAHKDLQGQGLFSRCLIAWPTSAIGTRFQHDEDPATEGKLQHFNQRLLYVFQKPLSLVPGTKNELLPTILVLDEDATECWSNFADWVEAEQARGREYESIQGFASKMVENALRIAGVMTIVENPDARVITKNMLINAGRIMHYFASEQLRIYDSSNLDDDTRNAELLLNWLQNEYDDDHITMRVIQREGPRKFRDTKIAHKTISTLIEFRWLVPAPPNVKVQGRVAKSVAWIIQR